MGQVISRRFKVEVCRDYITHVSVPILAPIYFQNIKFFAEVEFSSHYLVFKGFIIKLAYSLQLFSSKIFRTMIEGFVSLIASISLNSVS